MKKLIIALGIGALVLFGCTEQEAEAMEVQNNIKVSAGDINASFDQDGNEFSVGFGAFPSIKAIQLMLVLKYH